MKQTDPFINTALLGTASRELQISEISAALQPVCEEIRATASDPESAFYKQAAVAFAYDRAGKEPLKAEATSAIAEAPEEELPYFSPEAGQLLTLLQSQKYYHLLLYAYRKAAHSGKLISPEYLPSLLRQAFEKSNPQKGKEQMLLAGLAGKRGSWLLPLLGYPAWNADEQEDWETATHARRKEILSQMRHRDPAAARERLQSEWKNETATHRDELLQCMRTGLSLEDEEWLESVMNTDRSSTVKDTARDLLSRLPDSRLTQTYCNLLRGKLSYRTLLGWKLHPIDFTPEMKKLGLEELSRDKKESDAHYLLRQLCERVPLSFWSETFGCNAEEAAVKLAKHPPLEKFYVGTPILRFNDRLWAWHTLKTLSSRDYQKLLKLLTPAQREEIKLVPGKYYDFPVPEPGEELSEERWGPKYSNYALLSLTTEHYYIPKETAETIALYIAPQSLPAVEEKADRQNIQNFFSQLKTCMELKQQIDRLFA